MKTYEVRAKPWERGWELDIEDLGVTQSRSLGDAEETVRDYIALDLNVPASSFGVTIIPETDESHLDALTDEERRIARDFIETLRRAHDSEARREGA